MNKTKNAKTKNAVPSNITLTKKETKEVFDVLFNHIGDLSENNFNLQSDNEDLEITNDRLADANLNLSNLLLKVHKKYRRQLVWNLILGIIVIVDALYFLISMHVL